MLENLIVSTVLLLLFLAIRKILDGRISAKLQYGIWLVVAVRLLLAWMPLPGSSVSIMNLVPLVQEAVQDSGQRLSVEKSTETEKVISGQEPESVASQEENTVSQNVGLQQTQTGLDQDQDSEPESSDIGNGSAVFVRDHLIDIVYGTGVGIVLLWFVVKNFRFWYGIRRRRILYTGDLPDVSLPGRLYILEHLKSPFLFGKNIYVSPEMIRDPQQLYHILLHETCHWRQGDSLWSVLRNACLAMYWYHPLVWYGARLSVVDAELACDERVLQILGDESRVGYGETLLGLIREQADFLGVTSISTQMSGSKRETEKRLERIVEMRRKTRGRILFLAVSTIVLCIITLPGKQSQVDIVANAEWEKAEQEGFPEGFPCIVVDEQGNITGTKQGELLTKVYLNYFALDAHMGTEYQNYQILADAFSQCKNLKTLILPYQNSQKFTDVIDYIDPDAFRGCSQDLTVYCEKNSYVWIRLHELGITVKEYNDDNWRLLGENTAALERLQDRLDTGVDGEEYTGVLTDQEMIRFYGEPFFFMSESGRILSDTCDSLAAWVSDTKHIYLPADAQTLNGTFANFLMSGMSITIPRNVTEIGDWSFMASELSEIRFEEGSKLQTIGLEGFSNAKITEIQLPEGLQAIETRAFSQCYDLREVTIPASVRSIGEGCFGLCTSLERVVILNPDITLGKGAFPTEILNPDLGEDEIDMEDLDSNFIPNNRLTIVCHKGSNAEKYALENKVQVEYLE